jgi:two-component system response regulator RegA
MNKTSHILIIDDDSIFCSTLERALQRRGYEVATANTLSQANDQLIKKIPDYAIVDLKLSANESGLDFIPALRSQCPNTKIVMLTGYSSIPTAVEAVKRGADNYLCKPASVDEILASLKSSQRSSSNENESPSPPSLDRLQWEHIQRVLQGNKGNISATARALGMHRRTLQRKLQKRPVKQ